MAIHSLPEHHSLLSLCQEYFRAIESIEGIFLSGSTATGEMDQWSDLDLGIVCESEEARQQLWSQRWHWPIAPWIHRFDADHIKPYFVIYFFKSSNHGIHVDFNLYTMNSLPAAEAGPFRVVFERGQGLSNWAALARDHGKHEVRWDTADHEDERFWAWMHYATSHVCRGELYDAVSFLKDLRGIVERWEARLNGLSQFTSRRAESIYSQYFLERMAETFCRPVRRELRTALIALSEIQLRQRDRAPTVWTVQKETINEISRFVRSIPD